MKISSYGRQGSMGNFAHVFGHEQRLLFYPRYSRRVCRLQIIFQYLKKLR